MLGESGSAASLSERPGRISPGTECGSPGASGASHPASDDPETSPGRTR